VLDVFDIPSPEFNVKTFISAPTATGASSWQTWVKPRGCSFIHIFAVGGGGGGGAAIVGDSYLSTGCGGGGGSGTQSSLLFLADNLPDMLFIQVGNGGEGGTGAGVAGGTSVVSIAAITTGNLVLISTSGGSGGGLGSGTTSGLGGNGGATTTIASSVLSYLAQLTYGGTISIAGQAGTAGGTFAMGGVNLVLPITGLIVTGGTGGGSANAPGGNFITPVGDYVFPVQLGGLANIGVDSKGSNGFKVPNLLYFYGGTGGGSNFFGNGVGGSGGIGSYGCGGGGGGLTYDTGLRASGGKGGSGFVTITAY